MKLYKKKIIIILKILRTILFMYYSVAFIKNPLTNDHPRAAKVQSYRWWDEWAPLEANDCFQKDFIGLNYILNFLLPLSVGWLNKKKKKRKAFSSAWMHSHILHRRIHMHTHHPRRHSRAPSVRHMCTAPPRPWMYGRRAVDWGHAIKKCSLNEITI